MTIQMIWQPHAGQLVRCRHVELSDLLVAHSLGEAFKCAQQKGAVIRPRSGRLIPSAEFTHLADRIFIPDFPTLELDRDAKGVSDQGP